MVEEPEDPEEGVSTCLGLQHWHRALESDLENYAEPEEQTDLATSKKTELKQEARSR